MPELGPRENQTLLDGLTGQWRLSFVLAALGVAGMSVYTSSRTPVWQAETTMLVPPPSFSLVNVTGSSVSSLASSLTGPSVLRINKMLLESHRALEDVREKAGLPGSASEQRRALVQMRDVQTESTSNTVTLTIRHEKPEVARKISHLYVQALRRLSGKLNVQKSGGEADVIAATLKNRRAELRSAEKDLQTFQESAHTASSITPMSGAGQGDAGSAIVTPGDWLTQLRQGEIELENARKAYRTLSTTANTAASVSGKIPTAIPFTERLRQAVIDRETDYRLLENKLGPDAPQLIKARRDVEVSERQLKKEIDRYQQSLNLGVSERALGAAALQEAQVQGKVNALRQLAAAAPGEARQYMDLVRRVSVLSAITNRLESQLSLANLARTSDPNAWNVVDDAVVGERPVNKNYIRNGAIGAGAGIFLGLLVSLVRAGQTRPSSRRAGLDAPDGRPSEA